MEDFLAHYGTLGMKWGVRKNDTRISALEKEADQYFRRTNLLEYSISAFQNAARSTARYVVSAATLGLINYIPQWQMLTGHSTPNKYQLRRS